MTLVLFSDDDLVPFAMSNDPDSSVPEPPRYLRTLIKGSALIVDDLHYIASSYS